MVLAAIILAAVLTIVFFVLLLAILLLPLIEPVFLAIVRGFLAVITILAILGVTRVPEFGFARSGGTRDAIALANLHLLSFIVTFEIAVTILNLVVGTLGPGTVGTQCRRCHHDR